MCTVFTGGIMEIVLMVAVILTALAIVTQAGVLVGMYLMSRRLASKAETLMSDSRRLMAPLESITQNLTSISNDLAETGKMARDEMQHIQELLGETRDIVRGQIAEVREVVLDTVDEARDIMMRPVREYSAIMSGISAGIRTFFGRKKVVAEAPVEEIEVMEIEIEDRHYPAA